jgi:hypothetical protein
MKKFIVLIMFFCFITAGCAKTPVDNVEVSTPIKAQNYIGRFSDNVSLYKGFGEKLIIQKEQDKGLDLFSLDIDKAILSFEYTVTPQDNLLYYKQLDVDRTLKVKQLGNSEENNTLVLEGKATKNIAKRIAYSEAALVSTSPSQKYILYCTVDDIFNRYSLQLYNVETEETLILIDAVNDVLLNDMQGNISWSPNEAYLAVSNKYIYNVENGKLISEINAESILWSTAGGKLAYTKLDKGFGKAISILDVNTADIDEVFVVNNDEYLPGYIVWNENETKLAFVTALIGTKEEKENIDPYKAIYSLDLAAKEAVRIDTALKMEIDQVSKLENMHYNRAGNILAITMQGNLGNDLYVYNISTNECKLFLNIDYLHYEDNEDYICNAGNSIYFVQGYSIIGLDENMNTKLIYKSNDILEDIYISKDGGSMIIVEKSKDKIVLRQLNVLH